MARTIFAPGDGNVQLCGLMTAFAAVTLIGSRLRGRTAVLARAHTVGVTAADR
jgi:hypothetical protein